MLKNGVAYENGGKHLFTCSVCIADAGVDSPDYCYCTSANIRFGDRFNFRGYRYHAVDDSLIDRYVALLNTCEFARYAPVSSNDELDTVFAEAVAVIEALEGSIKK